MILAGLRDELDGELVTSDSPGYEAVRRPANRNYRDAHPRLVIRCGSAADVVLGIRYAQDNGISIVPRGGGHCFAGRSSTNGMGRTLPAGCGATVSIAGLTLGGGVGLLGHQ